MKVSVVIPTFNSASVIKATLDSVLRQTAAADEILVLDDGSTDNTVSILRSYEPRLTILQQQNRGVAPARNALCEQAKGDLIAFLDHDDLWHCHYLEVQRSCFAQFQNAVAFFTGHVNFRGFGDYTWGVEPTDTQYETELIEPLQFLERYNKTTGIFGSMSFCAVPKRILTQIGSEPFCVSGVDDSYLCTLLPFFGPVFYHSAPMVAYRITPQAQSANRLKSMGLWVRVFELLDDRYRNQKDEYLGKSFRRAFAAKRRRYGKILMGAGDVRQARYQFSAAAKLLGDPVSIAKSLALLILTYGPKLLQPPWASGDRELELAGH